MCGYHVYSEATAGEELLCEREPRNTKDSNCYAYSASCGKRFRTLNIRGLTSSAKLTATTVYATYSTIVQYCKLCYCYNIVSQYQGAAVQF